MSSVVSQMYKWECDELPREAVYGYDCEDEYEKCICRNDPFRHDNIPEDQLSIYTDLNTTFLAQGCCLSEYHFHSPEDGLVEAERSEFKEDGPLHLFLYGDYSGRLQIAPGTTNVYDERGDDDTPSRCGIHRPISKFRR